MFLERIKHLRWHLRVVTRHIAVALAIPTAVAEIEYDYLSTCFNSSKSSFLSILRRKDWNSTSDLKD